MLAKGDTACRCFEYPVNICRCDKYKFMSAMCTGIAQTDVYADQLQAVRESHEGYICSLCCITTHQHPHIFSRVSRRWGKQVLADHVDLYGSEGYWYSCPSDRSWCWQLYLQYSFWVQQCFSGVSCCVQEWRCHNIFTSSKAFWWADNTD